MDDEQRDTRAPGHDSHGRQIRNDGRRNLLKGGLAAGPVVLTLRGQSALAATGCASPSTIASGNLSPGHTQPVCGTGFSPGYWKVCQHLSQWRPFLTAPTFKIGDCTTGMPKSSPLTEGTRFNQISPFVNSGALGSYGAWRILAFPTVVDKDLAAFNINQVQLARHLIASYLNLKTVGSTFPLNEAQLKSMWEQGSVDAYCPSSSCTPTQLWTAQMTVCYLRNYTMDQTSVSQDPITWIC